MQNAVATSVDITALQAVIVALQQENDYLRWQLAKARHERFGRSSERGDLLDQLPLYQEEVVAFTADLAGEPADSPSICSTGRAKRQRPSLPDTLPREEHVLLASESCVCLACGGTLKFLGEDVSETLEYVPASFKVLRTVRPKLACGR